MGLFVAVAVYLSWICHLAYLLAYVNVDFTSFAFYFHILLQGYLFTGLFITGHDAMHGTVSGNRKINDLAGWIATLSFAYLSYGRLRKNHYLHHRFPATEKDPDFYTGSNNFFAWWFKFLVRYTTWWQLVSMAITFNILKIWFTDWQLIFFWVIPAVLGTLQLFFFGTFIPHRLPHKPEMGIHKARTLPKNHFLAMITCYFFGYHREHHESPTTPWWKLYRSKKILSPAVH